MERCVYGSPACEGPAFKSLVGARQHWSCLPGSVFSAVVTGLQRSMPELRDQDRALLASVAAWAAFGAMPSLAAEIASGTGRSSQAQSGNDATDALRAAVQTVLGADVSAEVEEAGRVLFGQAVGRLPSSPQLRTVLNVVELQLRRVSAVPEMLIRDRSGVAYVERELGAKAQEAFWVIPVDAAQQARSFVTVSSGEYHSVGVPVPAVLSAVLQSGTDVFWVAHNHPT